MGVSSGLSRAACAGIHGPSGPFAGQFENTNPTSFGQRPGARLPVPPAPSYAARRSLVYASMIRSAFSSAADADPPWYSRRIRVTRSTVAGDDGGPPGSSGQLP